MAKRKCIPVVVSMDEVYARNDNGPVENKQRSSDVTKLIHEDDIAGIDRMYPDTKAFLTTRFRAERMRAWLYPVHIAAREGSYKILQVLLNRGADINARDQVLNSVLHWSVFKGRSPMLRFCLLQGADVNAKNSLDWTPLHSSAAQGEKQLIQILLMAGGKNLIKFGDQYKNTPSQEAKRRGHQELSAIMETYFDERRPPWAEAICNGDLTKLKSELLATRLTDTFGCTPVHYAAMFGSTDVIHALAELGCDMNAQDNEFKTPLHYLLQLHADPESN